jgi:drug/metabolite transporter (DMT)-like permease
MRFGISAIFTLPIVIYLKPWRGIPPSRIGLLAFLAGIPYVLILYAAFTYAPASHGGVFMNGPLPAMTLFWSWLWLKQTPSRGQLVGVALVFTGAALAAIAPGDSRVASAWVGDILFLGAALFFSAYLTLNQVWKVTIPLVFLSLSVVNSLVYMPIWFFLLPSGLSEAATDQILLQAGYQGLLPNLVGLSLLTFAVRHVGPSITAALMSAVPALGALLSLMILGERLNLLAWFGIIVLTAGILLTALRRPNSS